MELVPRDNDGSECREGLKIMESSWMWEMLVMVWREVLNWAIAEMY